MIFLKDIKNNEIFAYDKTQINLVKEKLNNNFLNVTDDIKAQKIIDDKLKLALKPLYDWQKKMQDSDKLPRWAEDIIEVLTATQKASLSLETKKLYDDKKLIRGQKPV